MSARRGPSDNTNAPSFDPQRMKPPLYNHLRTPQDAANFTSMVKDYMAYVRADPTSRFDYEESREESNAFWFVFMVSSKEGWPLAKECVPEFQTAWPLEQIEEMPWPMDYILTGVRARLPQPGAN